MTLGRAIILTVFSVALARAADVPYEFTGVLTADGKTRIALTNKATKTTEWVEAGGQLGGYSIARYEAKDDAGFLQKRPEENPLPLTSAHNPAPVTATISPGRPPS